MNVWADDDETCATITRIVPTKTEKPNFGYHHGLCFARKPSGEAKRTMHSMWRVVKTGGHMRSESLAVRVCLLEYASV